MTPKTVRVSLFHFAFAALLAAVVAWTAGTATAWAQKGAAGGLSKADVNKILREQNLPDTQKTAFQSYFKKEFFPPFNSSTPATYDKYFRLRGQLKIFLNTGRSGAAHDELNRLTLTAMKAIVASSKADMGARVNAIWVIGELNEVDEPGKAKPLQATFPFLFGVVKSPKFKDGSKVPDGLKVPALAGLERFAAADAIPAAEKDEVAKLMLDLVNQQTPPANRTAQGHDWMRRGAARVLAKMGSTGPNNSVVKAFAGIVADPQARPTLRCEVAELLGQLKYPPAAKVDLQALSKLVGHQAVEIGSEELDRAKSLKKTPSLQLIVYALYSAREGLAGLQGAAGDASQKQAIADLHKKFEIMHAELDDPELADDSIESEVRRRLSDLQNLLGPKAPPAKEEVAAARPKEPPSEPAKP